MGVLGLEHKAFEQPTPDVAGSLQSIALLAADGVNRVRILEAKRARRRPRPRPAPGHPDAVTVGDHR